MKLGGKAKMLRIHFGEDDKWQGKPLYQAIVDTVNSFTDEILSTISALASKRIPASTRARNRCPTLAGTDDDS